MKTVVVLGLLRELTIVSSVLIFVLDWNKIFVYEKCLDLQGPLETTTVAQNVAHTFSVGVVMS